MKGLLKIGFALVLDLGSKITHKFIQFLAVRLDGKTLFWYQAKVFFSPSQTI